MDESARQLSVDDKSLALRMLSYTHRSLLLSAAWPCPSDDSCIALFIAATGRIERKRHKTDLTYRRATIDAEVILRNISETRIRNNAGCIPWRQLWSHTLGVPVNVLAHDEVLTRVALPV